MTKYLFLLKICLSDIMRIKEEKIIFIYFAKIACKVKIDDLKLLHRSNKPTTQEAKKMISINGTVYKVISAQTPFELRNSGKPNTAAQMKKAELLNSCWLKV